VSTSHNTIITNRENDVFTLPERVARENGLFEKHGVHVEVALLERPEFSSTVDPLKNNADAAFEKGGADTHNLCEWGAIDRVERGSAKGRIGYLRPAVVVQAIVSWQDDIQEPHDLADIEVHTAARYYGAHYNVLQILEGVLRRDQIKVAFSGVGFRERQEKAKTGEFKAITLMEPWLSLALKNGAHIVGLAYYRGGTIFADHVPQATRENYVAAINEAVDTINADPKAYRRHLTELTNGELEPEELSGLFHRYTHAKHYSEKRFAESYAWMNSWGLAKGASEFEAIIKNAA